MWPLAAVDGAMFALNPMELGCDADENRDVGLDGEYSFSPLCDPEKENIWLFSTWNFQVPAIK